MLYLTLFGFLTPIFSLFLKDQIPDSTLIGIGLAEAIYLLSLAILRPFAQLTTRSDMRGWRIQAYLLFGSGLIISTPFLYLLSRSMLDIYVIQMLYGIGIAFSEPAWSCLMERTCSIKPAPRWEPYNSSTTLVAAGLALIGGFIAQQNGIPTLFFYVGTLLFLSTVFVFLMYRRFCSKLSRPLFFRE